MTSTQALQLGVIACDELASLWNDEAREEMLQAAKVLKQLKQSLTKPAEMSSAPIKQGKRKKVSHWDKQTREVVATQAY